MIVLVGIFFYKYLAIDKLFYFENAIKFLTSYEVVMQKLVRARKAKPSSKIERNPPIILNHYSTTFLSFL